MKNKQLALKLLAKDCRITNYYLKDGKTCAVGCLALASRVSERHLASASVGVACISWPQLQEVRRKIKAMFGLDSEQLVAIQEANDGEGDLRLRRQRVARVIRSFATP